MEVTKHYFPVRLFTSKLYKVILMFVRVNEILMCDHLDESYWAVPSWSAVNYTVERGCLHVWVWVLTKQYFPVVLLIHCL